MRSRAATIAVALSLLVGTVLGAAPTTPAPALEPRLVVIKVDGLPQSAVDKYVARIDHRTGRSALPWIRHLFYDSGIRVANFYSRGISLSEPSWAIIDTGQHSIIKGNFEVDRSTGDSIDHLSFVGFYADSVRSRRVFPSGVEALDAARTPLTSDAWRFEDRDTGIQLLRRGTRWFDLLKVGVDPARSGSIGERIGDLIVGVNEVEVWSKIAEQSFLKALLDPRIRYADLYWPYIDEAIHDDNSEASVLGALVKFDRMLGRAQQAIAQSGTADRTVLVVVSDHGATYDSEGLYSQGVNLISYLERPEFGAHHTISRGGPLANYELKGSAFQPFASGATLLVAAFGLPGRSSGSGHLRHRLRRQRARADPLSRSGSQPVADTLEIDSARPARRLATRDCRTRRVGHSRPTSRRMAVGSLRSSPRRVGASSDARRRSGSSNCVWIRQ
ncbi:MAG: alkaline phosphatase family protein [Blastocatellia bacterium]|nr:alkaline phosphatase family protein [Blastocatellia bacterium]